MSTTQDRTGHDRGSLAMIALVAVAASAVAFVPHFLRDADAYETDPGLLVVGWVALLVLPGPVAAAAAASRRPVVTTFARAVLVGAPQVLLMVLLVRTDVWTEFRSGYLVRGVEEGMAYGAANVVGTVAGVLLAVLVAAAAAVTTSAVRRRGERLPARALV